MSAAVTWSQASPRGRRHVHACCRAASLLLLLVVSVCPRQPVHAEPPHQPVNLSFLHPISTNRDPGISTNFRLSILYARAGAVRGVDLGGLVARTDGDFRGLEFAAAHSWIGGELRGFAATGLVSAVRGEARGLQLAGLVNFDREAFTGVQGAGLFNSVDGEIVGAQLSSFFNLSGGDARWLQLAGVANVCGDSLIGAQLSSFNFTTGGLTGLQVGAGNFASHVYGVQASLVNLAGDVRGAQIGAVNISQRLDGVPLGLVNLSEENGELDWLVLGSNLAAISIGVRTAIGGLYSMVTAGAIDLHDDRSNTLMLDWHYGWATELTPRLRLGGDLGFVHFIPHPSDDPQVNDRLHFAVQPRIVAEQRVGQRIRILGGAGASVIWNEYSKQATSDTEPLVLLGISFQ